MRAKTQQPCAVLIVLSSLVPCVDNKERSFLEHLFMVAIIIRSLHPHPSPCRLWVPSATQTAF